jgi:mannose-6-phosphate isomerase class I
MLEWVPVDGGPTTFRDIERILLRTSWMYYSGIIDDVGTSENDYVTRTLRIYGDPSHKADLRNGTKAFTEQLATFKQRVEVCQQLSFDIQSELLRGNSDATAVKSLGDKLSEAENEVCSSGNGSSISFLSELLAVLCENIEKKDLLDLSTKTIGICRDIMAIADLMTSRSKDMAVLLSSRNHLHL